MDKKGVETRTLLWMFYILLVLIITYFLYSFVNDFETGKGFSKRYFVNDLGLMVDAVSSSNHDLEIKYYNLGEYNLRFSKGRIELVNENIRYNYASDNNLEMFNGEILTKDNSSLTILKNGNIVYITSDENFKGSGGEFGGGGASG